MSQRGGKAELPSEDSLVLGRPADDEPDLHWHCLAKPLVHLGRSRAGFDFEGCGEKVDGRRAWSLRFDLTAAPRLR